MKSICPTKYSVLFSGALLALAALPAHAGYKQDVEQYNKKVISNFVAAIGSSLDADAVVRAQVAPFVIQHDSLVTPGREGTAAWIRELRAKSPAQTMTVKHLLADGDMVFVHSHVSATPGNEMGGGTNRYDFYRMDKGWIVEHWAVKAKAPTRSANGNSQFSNLYAYPATPAPAVMTPERTEMNRLMLVTLSDEVFDKKNFGLIDRMWGPNYLQHNPAVGNGRAALASVIQYIASPGSSYRVTRSMADGDLGVVCAQSLEQGEAKNDYSGWIVCDMYRVANFELVEHWDVAQAVPATSLNGNSMFSSLYRKAK